MGTYDDLEKCTGFDWDDGNLGKNWEKHDITDGECEEIFFDDPLIVGADPKQPKRERRYYALGRSDSGRGLFVGFTIRGRLIRAISARDMTKAELRKYTRHEQEKEGATIQD